MFDRGNYAKALEIVKNELEVFTSHGYELFKDITPLLTLDNLRCKLLAFTLPGTILRLILFQELS